MRKFFVTNLFFLLTLNILIKSFWILGIDRGIQNAVSAQEYGVYFALLNFTYLFNILLDFGITNYNNRMIARHTNLLKKYFARIVPLKMGLAAVYMLVVIVTGLCLGYDSWQTKMLFWLSLTQVLSSFVAYFRSNITSLMLFKTDSVISVLDRFLLIVICGFMLWNDRLRQGFTVEKVVYVQFLTMFITFAAALTVCLVKTGRVRLKWNKVFGFLLLRDGLPFAVLGLLMACYNKMDSVMLLSLVDDNGKSSGIYASGFRLVDSANMVSYLFSVILLPLFSKMIKENGNVKDVMKAAFHLLLIITTAFVAVSLLYSRELMELLYNKHIEESAAVYRLLSFCFVPVSMTYIFGTLLTANGSLKYLNIVAGLGMLMNIGLNFILIPLFQQNGAAITSLVTQTVTAVLQAWLALKIFKVRFDWKYCLKIVFYVFAVMLAALAVQAAVQASWVLKIVLTLVLFVVMAFVARVLSLKDVKSLVE